MNEHKVREALRCAENQLKLGSTSVQARVTLEHVCALLAAALAPDDEDRATEDIARARRRLSPQQISAVALPAGESRDRFVEEVERLLNVEVAREGRARLVAMGNGLVHSERQAAALERIADALEEIVEPVSRLPERTQ